MEDGTRSLAAFNGMSIDFRDKNVFLHVLPGRWLLTRRNAFLAWCDGGILLANRRASPHTHSPCVIPLTLH
ncbi:hypothetical protein E2C01_068571 [Portunus trituberculatus]|uniref:Uncharacterized protein n=1 Tax=Portunus trituberculatus TaxID=210409 RepID=A0A5B7HWT5_PORTR|nr:hypothetical protein [Portunus trituberculatus]